MHGAPGQGLHAKQTPQCAARRGARLRDAKLRGARAAEGGKRGARTQHQPRSARAARPRQWVDRSFSARRRGAASAGPRCLPARAEGQARECGEHTHTMTLRAAELTRESRGYSAVRRRAFGARAACGSTDACSQDPRGCVGGRRACAHAMRTESGRMRWRARARRRRARTCPRCAPRPAAQRRSRPAPTPARVSASSRVAMLRPSDQQSHHQVPRELTLKRRSRRSLSVTGPYSSHGPVVTAACLTRARDSGAALTCCFYCISPRVAI